MYILHNKPKESGHAFRNVHFDQPTNRLVVVANDAVLVLERIALAVVSVALGHGGLLVRGDLLLASGAHLLVAQHVGLHRIVLGRLPALAMPRLARHDGGLSGDLLAAVRARLHV